MMVAGTIHISHPYHTTKLTLTVSANAAPKCSSLSSIVSPTAPSIPIVAKTSFAGPTHAPSSCKMAAVHSCSGSLRNHARISKDRKGALPVLFVVVWGWGLGEKDCLTQTHKWITQDSFQAARSCQLLPWALRDSCGTRSSSVEHMVGSVGNPCKRPPPSPPAGHAHHTRRAIQATGVHLHSIDSGFKGLLSESLSSSPRQ